MWIRRLQESRLAPPVQGEIPKVAYRCPPGADLLREQGTELVRDPALPVAVAESHGELDGGIGQRLGVGLQRRGHQYPGMLSHVTDFALFTRFIPDLCQPWVVVG